MTSQIPDQLTRLPQWVTWNHETRGGKGTKVPYVAGSQARASSTDPSTWRDYESAEADRTKSGVGFVFSADDPFVGIDLDDCLNPDGSAKPWAAEIIDSLPSTYTEVSPSGNGLKMFMAAEMPEDGRNRRKVEDGQIEIYSRGRYFTVTGDRWGDSPLKVEHADLSAVYQRLFPSHRGRVAVPDHDHGGGFGGSNESMIEAIARSESGRKFTPLWGGDFSNYIGDDGRPDQSRGDQALCNILAFWCGPNPKRIDRVFRMSGLYRDKWDRVDYRDRTIDSAIAAQTSFYQPRDSVHINDDSVVLKRAREQRPLAMTDIGNAERLVHHFAGRIKFCERAGGWYVWNGTHWQQDKTGTVMYYAVRAVREIYTEGRLLDDDESKDAMRKHGVKSEGQPRVSAMVKLAGSMPSVAINSDDFDRDPWLFNCKNGTVDLKTGALQPHRSGDNITKCSPASYHPRAIAPLWLKFLDRIFHGNVELIEYVQELLGMSLSGDISEQIMPVFFGGGSNGKSTLLDTVMEVMGTYAGKAAPDLLMARHGEVHPTEVADLWGLRLAVASETEENRKLRSSLIKEMTGDAELKARYMRGDFFNFRRTHKLVLMTNHKPRIADASHGMWRRLKLVPFDAEITAEERDRGLADKLRAEWPGILAWLVQGCIRWREAGGLDDPAEVRNATSDYRDDEDPLAEFVDAKISVKKSGFATNKSVRSAYVKWCKDEGVSNPMGERALFSRLSEISGVRKGRRSIEGVKHRGFEGLVIGPGISGEG